MCALKGTEAFERPARERRKVEMAFAHRKQNSAFRWLRLHGVTGATDEFLPTATVQNKKAGSVSGLSPANIAWLPRLTTRVGPQNSP
jgi:hypothetical protein